MAPTHGCASQHHAMGVERRGRDRGTADAMQEAAVGLQGVEEGAVDVEDVDVMAFGAD